MYTVIFNYITKQYDVVRKTNSLIKTVISSHDTFHDAINDCVIKEREASVVRCNFED
jgi:hypothetical protein